MSDDSKDDVLSMLRVAWSHPTHNATQVILNLVERCEQAENERDDLKVLLAQARTTCRCLEIERDAARREANDWKDRVWALEEAIRVTNVG